MYNVKIVLPLQISLSTTSVSGTLRIIMSTSLLFCTTCHRLYRDRSYNGGGGTGLTSPVKVTVNNTLMTKTLCGKDLVRDLSPIFVEYFDSLCLCPK